MFTPCPSVTWKKYSRARGISHVIWFMLLSQKQGSGLSSSTQEAAPFLLCPSLIQPCLLSGSHRPQATGTEGASRIEMAQFCFSCLPQWKGASPTQPQEMSSHLQGGVRSPSSLFSRNQRKNFSARLATHMLCKQPRNTLSLSEPEVLHPEIPCVLYTP